MSTFDWSQLHVLIVEDEKELRETLASLFESRKARVSSAANGLEALKILGEESVDFVLSDIRMPECDGLELLRRVRLRDPELPVVFLATGFADIDPQDAITRGASGLLHKPFSMRELFRTLEEALSKKKFPKSS